MSGAAAAKRIFAILPAAGRGERFASGAAPPKQYAPLAGRTLLEWSLVPLLDEPRIAGTVVVVAAGDVHWPRLAAALAGARPGDARLDGARLDSAIGGASRQSSVANGLAHLAGRAAPDDWVLVHDAARPCLTAQEIRDLLAALDALDARDARDGRDERGAGAGGAVLAAPIVDTVKRESASGAIETVDRTGLWRALTPQVFSYSGLVRALGAAAAAGVTVTDEAQAMERIGVHATLVPGSPFNIKVTRAEDLQTAARILGNREGTRMRIGQGFDAHRFGDGDHVVLGGVRLAHDRAIVAHSDGDVVIHALCDAILGALGAGDIGQHFPDSDPRYRGADSRVFLRAVGALAHTAGLVVVNADITVLAEAPRIASHRAAMAANLAADLGIAPGAVNVKATTTERMGFIGRGEGLAALANVLLDQARSST